MQHLFRSKLHKFELHLVVSTIISDRLFRSNLLSLTKIVYRKNNNVLNIERKSENDSLTDSKLWQREWQCLIHQFVLVNHRYDEFNVQRYQDFCTSIEIEQTHESFRDIVSEIVRVHIELAIVSFTFWSSHESLIIVLSCNFTQTSFRQRCDLTSSAECIVSDADDVIREFNRHCSLSCSNESIFSFVSLNEKDFALWSRENDERSNKRTRLNTQYNVWIVETEHLQSAVSKQLIEYMHTIEDFSMSHFYASDWMRWNQHKL